MRPTRFQILIVSGWLLALSASTARADDDVEDSGSVEAVQNREYRMGQELEVAASLLPYDAFYKGVAPTFAFTTHFTDTLAWEVFRVGYSVDFDTGLKTQLLALGTQPTQFEETQLYVTSDFLYSPLYFKGTIFNQAVVHGEGYLLVGGGAFQESGNFHPAPNVGLGFRIFLSKLFSVRFESRDSVVLDQALTNVFDVNLGLCLNLFSPG